MTNWSLGRIIVAEGFLLYAFAISMLNMAFVVSTPNIFLCVLLVLLAGCSQQTAVPEQASEKTPATPQVAMGIPLNRLRAKSEKSIQSTSLRFAKLSEDSQPGFTYVNGSRGKRLMVEATGGGCGWLDFDRDGSWDLYFVQGGYPDEQPSGNAPNDCLWRQTGGQFGDVTSDARIIEKGYSQGVSIGDFDNDGFDDIFVTNVGNNTLLRNQGDGTFAKIETWGGQGSQLWSSSCAWGDIDLDGDLDLYVCNYCDFDPYHPQICTNASGVQIQCAPNQVSPVGDELYLNEGDGNFVPIASEMGLTGPENRALGVVIADFRGDLVPEIYVANDASANFMFVRDSSGRYNEIAARLGCALDANGIGQASMGIATGDYNRDGLLDLYLTHFEGEWNTLYLNLGEFGFRDATADLKLVQSTLPWVGFGVIMEDFDQNGYEDIFVSNGHIDDRGRKQVLEMPPLLLTYDGLAWHETQASAGPYFDSRYVGRGCSQADLDNDGDFDIAVVHQNQPASILVNESQRGNWLSLELIGRTSNRHGIGARVEVQQGANKIVQQLVAGGSYCSSRQPRLIFGLGESASPCTLNVRWPNGAVQSLLEVPVNQQLVIREGLQ